MTVSEQEALRVVEELGIYPSNIRTLGISGSEERHMEFNYRGETLYAQTYYLNRDYVEYRRVASSSTINNYLRSNGSNFRI